MKLKLFALAAVVSAVVVSCSTDRDEEDRMKAIESVKNSNQNINLNKPGTESREVEVNSIIASDTIKIMNPTSGATAPINSIDPDDGETIDPTKPDKPW